METNAAAVLTQKLASMWLNVRLEGLGLVIIAATTFLSIEGDTPPSLVGLALVYALEITKYLKHGTDMASQTESKMNAVERLLEFSDLPQEAPEETTEEAARKVPRDWPARGEVEVQNLSGACRFVAPVVAPTRF